MGPVQPTLGRPRLHRKEPSLAAKKGNLVEAKKADDKARAEPQDEPSDVNSALASPRMKALLEEHRAMGVRPK